LRIAVDARELLGRPRGVGRFLKEILEVWQRLPEPRHELFLIVPEGRPDPAYFEVQEGQLLETGEGLIASGSYWEQVVLPAALRRLKPDVLLAPGYSLPLMSRVPAVLAVHDLSFEARPEWFGRRERFRRRFLTRRSVGRARRVVTGSRFSARELERHYGLSAERCLIVPYGVSERFRPATPSERESVASAYGLSGARIVLSVGTLLERRATLTLIEAFARAHESQLDAQLVLIGEDRRRRADPVFGRAHELGVGRAVRWIEHVPESALPALYSLAQVVVYLSSYEGFGLPPLEALACGARVVASPVPSLVETPGVEATLVDESSCAAVSEALARRLAEPERPGVQPSWVKSMSWRSSSEKLLHALEEIA